MLCLDKKSVSSRTPFGNDKVCVNERRCGLIMPKRLWGQVGALLQYMEYSQGDGHRKVAHSAASANCDTLS